MRCWAATVSEDRFAGERLYSFDTLTLPSVAVASTADLPPDAVDPVLAAALGASPAGLWLGPETGDRVVLLVAGDPARLFGFAEVEEVSATGDLVLRYTRRRFDDPIPASDLVPDDGPLTELDDSAYAELVDRAGPAPRRARQDWFVSVSLPIEAPSAADAVREFWTYLAKLGPRELPAFVWPRGDELAMQAFVLGEEANQDPEED
jgi:hypothetical protein